MEGEGWLVEGGVEGEGWLVEGGGEGGWGEDIGMDRREIEKNRKLGGEMD